MTWWVLFKALSALKGRAASVLNTHQAMCRPPSASLCTSYTLGHFHAFSCPYPSLLRRQAPLVSPPLNTDDLPIWHNVYCRNENNHTYYCSSLIKQGVTTWGQFFGENHPRYHRTLPRTWKPVYTSARCVLNVVKPQDEFDLPVTWSTCWGKGFFLRVASPTYRDNSPIGYGKSGPGQSSTPQPKSSYSEHCGTSYLYTNIFSHSRARLIAWETVYHALSECKFYPMVFDSLHKSWGMTTSLGTVDDPDDGNTGPLTAKEIARPGQEFHSLKEPLGHLLCVAREAHWALRWHSKEGAIATLQTFLSIWVSMLVKWTSM